MTLERLQKISLLENSHTFMTDAVANAIAARENVGRWQFAIPSLVQAVELSLKELLRQKHPILIFDNIDRPQHTITLRQALSRIENHEILGIAIPDDEKKKIAKAVELRNQIIHYEFEFTPEYAMAKFSEMFAFLVYFQGRFLKLEVEEILPAKMLQSVVEIKECFAELRNKAAQRIHDEQVSQDLVWACPSCGEDTFVIEDARNVCFLRRNTAEVTECPQCAKLWFDEEIQSFFDQIDSDYSEGEVTIFNTYRYSQFNACPECISKIREDIEQQRAEDYY